MPATIFGNEILPSFTVYSPDDTPPSIFTFCPSASCVTTPLAFVLTAAFSEPAGIFASSSAVSSVTSKFQSRIVEPLKLR